MNSLETMWMRRRTMSVDRIIKWISDMREVGLHEILAVPCDGTG